MSTEGVELPHTRSDILTHYASGDVRLREVVQIVFYFNKPHLTMASKIQNAILDFVDLISLDALRYFYDLSGETAELSPESFSDLMDAWFVGQLSKYPNATIEIVAHDYSAPEYGIHYCGKGLDFSTVPDDTGFLHLWVPRQFFLANSARLDRYFSDALSQLPACSGYMSLGLSGEDMPAQQALASRYPCLNIASIPSVSIDLGTKCPGSYWKTFVGPELALHLGGIQAIGKALQCENGLTEMPEGGILIQLADLPELGDLDCHEVPDAYRLFARFLHQRESLHVPRKSMYFRSEDNRVANLAAQEDWHLRFLQVSGTQT